MALRAPNTYTAFVHPRYSFSERQDIGREIINFIVNRTKSGRGIGGRPFVNSRGQKKYSQNYIDDRDFAIAGKSPRSINLTLSGDMLDSIEILNAGTPGQIVIGFTSEEENDKSVFLREKGYDFLGLSSSELKSIVDKYGQPGRELTPANISEGFIENFLRGLLNNGS